MSHRPNGDPAHWERLNRLCQILFAYRKAPKGAAQRLAAQLQQVRAELLVDCHPLGRDTPLLAIPQTVRYAFVEAVGLSQCFQAAVMTQPPVNTVGDRTLAAFRPDFIPSVSLSELAQTFLLTPEQQQGVQQAQAQAQERITAKTRLMGLLRETYRLGSADAARSERIGQLFSCLYGALPLPNQLLGLVQTDTQLFFCLPFQGTELEALPDADQVLVRNFLERLQSPGVNSFNRYPVFGYFDSAVVPQPWLVDLGARLGYTADRVLDLLYESVSILPSAELEKFLVHDSWGHHWQASLTGFALYYRKLAQISAPLSPQQTTLTPDGPLALSQLFRVLPTGAVRLRPQRAVAFFEGEVAERLTATLIHVVAETAADLVEAKYALDVAPLPTSSVLKNNPTKLDLSLVDLWELCRRGLEPLLVALAGSSTAEALAELLTQETGVTVNILSLNLALAQLHALFYSRYVRFYQPTVTDSKGFFAQALSNLVYLQNTLDQLFHQPRSRRILLVIFLSCYCDQDPSTNFWNLDEVLACYFLSCVEQLSTREEPLGQL